MTGSAKKRMNEIGFNQWRINKQLIYDIIN